MLRSLKNQGSDRNEGPVYIIMRQLLRSFDKIDWLGNFNSFSVNWTTASYKDKLKHCHLYELVSCHELFLLRHTCIFILKRVIIRIRSDNSPRLSVKQT